MARELKSDTITRFRGLNRLVSITAVSPEQAIDQSNCIIMPGGGLQKFRIPQNIDDNHGLVSSGPRNIFDYQRSTDQTQRIVVESGDKILVYQWASPTSLGTPTVIDTNALNAARFDHVVSNSLCFMVNGLRNLKLVGSTPRNWGIAKPGAPTLGLARTISTITRAAGVVTVVLAGASLPFYPKVGDQVQIAGVADSGFNGIFPVATIISQISFTYAQAGANTSSSGGTALAQAEEQNHPIDTPTVGAVRTSAGLASIQISTLPHPVHNFSTGQKVVIAGVTDTSFNGTFTVTVLSLIQFTYQQFLGIASSGNGTAKGTLSASVGLKWRYCYKNSVTGHMSSASDPTALSPAGTERIYYVNPVAPTDPQVDTIVWFRTLDGGGDFFFHSEVLVATNGGRLADGFEESLLNKALRAPLINEPPPVGGKYMTKWGARVLILVGQEVAYSGYERILLGRPEESFPPNNRLRLQTGADTLGGIGVVSSGVVVFSFTNEMFMARGTLEDLVAGAPVAFSAFLQQLPWSIGIASHFTIQNTDRGFAFLDSGYSIREFDGMREPSVLSDGIEDILKRTNRLLSEDFRSARWYWMDKDWYVLFVPVDGSSILNKLIVIDLEPDSNFNVGAFQLDVTGDSIAVVEDTNGDQRLLVGESGRVKEVVFVSTDVNCITSNPPAATAASLPGWWRGVFGNDSPHLRKFYRRVRLIVAGAEPRDFAVRVHLFDREDVLNPEIIDAQPDKHGRIAVNRKARRMSVEIGFPNQDVTVNALELAADYFYLGQE